MNSELKKIKFHQQILLIIAISDDSENTFLLQDIIPFDVSEQKIMSFSQDQVTQIVRRANESTSIKLVLVGLNFIILMLFADSISSQTEINQGILGIIWLSLFFFLVSLSLYTYRMIVMIRLDKKVS